MTLPHQETPWKPLRLFNLYRIVLSGLLVVLFFINREPSFVGSYYPALFAYVAILYLLASIASSFIIQQRWVPFQHLVYYLVLLDIVAITLFTYSSGGVTSGLGTLMVVAIAGTSILVTGRMAILFASIGAIAIIIDEIYFQLFSSAIKPHYIHAGILGASMLATALLGYFLARRIQESEALAEKRSIDLANMEQLNQYIILHMQTGIIVVDDSDTVRMVNESACRLLNHEGGAEGSYLKLLSAPLLECLHNWKLEASSHTGTFKSSATSPIIQPRFAPLGTETGSGTLIFLEDTATMTQQAQQMKLASLGRLTASIAHEIRNPLGAIGHAGQLLNEGAGENEQFSRLTNIIMDNTRRMNRIIENILTLSRRDRSHPELFVLQPWLENIIEEFVSTKNLSNNCISREMTPEDIEIRMDPIQLHQVIWNLCSNALRHSNDTKSDTCIELKAGLLDDQDRPYLEIRDFGAGINEEDLEHIFEPFYTTESQGTGLGLYIARELCEANRARLDYVSSRRPGACFRITFADPRRRQVA